MVGDYGEIFWVSEGGSLISARAGGGGYGDLTDGVVRNIHEIYVIYPSMASPSINYYDSGEMFFYGNIFFMF